MKRFFCLTVAGIELFEFTQLGVLLAEPLERAGVRQHFGVRQLRLNLGQFREGLLQSRAQFVRKHQL